VFGFSSGEGKAGRGSAGFVEGQNAGDFQGWQERLESKAVRYERKGLKVKLKHQHFPRFLGAGSQTHSVDPPERGASGAWSAEGFADPRNQNANLVRKRVGMFWQRLTPGWTAFGLAGPTFDGHRRAGMLGCALIAFWALAGMMTSSAQTNPAPVLVTTNIPPLSAELENAGPPSGAVGTLISNLVDISGPNFDVIDSFPGAVTGIALVNTTNTAPGSWFYSTNNGSSWSPVPSVSQNAALLLAADSNTRLYFEPNTDFNGTISNAVAFQAWNQTSGFNGGVASATNNGGTTAFSTATGTANLTITLVNQAPSFVKGPDQTVLENAGPQTVPGWATNISAGPGNPSSETVNFVVAFDSNPGLFSAAPTVSTNGTLSYTPATNANGSATMVLVLMNNGGTNNGGVNTSAPQTFTITVLPVTQPPSFLEGPNQTVLENATNQSVTNWATAISPGPPNQSSETVNFLITTNSNPGLFSIAPAVSPTGTLTYQPAIDANGSASISLVLQNSGSTTNGGVNTSPPQTFTITVLPVTQPPTFLDKEGGRLGDGQYGW